MTAVTAAVRRGIVSPVSRWWARVRQRPATSASTALVAVAALGLLIAMFFADGNRATDYDLTESAVWVDGTVAGQQRIGRVNMQIPKQDDRLDIESGELLQDGRDVVVVDRDGGTVQRIDVVSVSLGKDQLEVPADSTVGLGGANVMVLGPGGNLWTAPTERFRGIRAGQDDPALELGPGALAEIAPNGRVVAYSAERRRLYWPEGQGYASRALPADANIREVTVAGDRPVALDADAGRLYLDGGEPIDVRAAGEQPRLQLPSADGSVVVVSGPEGSLQVQLDDGDGAATPVDGAWTDDLGAAGATPVRPARVRGCTYQAWYGAVYLEAVDCGEKGSFHMDLAAASQRAVAAGAKVVAAEPSEIRFRVNRDHVTLNALDGAVFAATGNKIIQVDDWGEEGDSQPTTTIDGQNPGTQKLDREQKPPVAVDDEYGARPGQATILGVLDNDSDPNGDPLSVELAERDAATQAEPTGARVSVVQGGQAVQIVAGPESAGRTITFRYRASDGLATSENEATVTVTIRTDSQNNPPEPKPSREPALEMRAGTRASYDVLQDWFDPDGDPIVLADAIPADTTTGDSVTFLPNGRVTYVDSGVGQAELEETSVQLVVADTFAPPMTAEGELPVKVRRGTAVDPVVRADFVTTSVGATVVIRPLDNDESRNGAPLRVTEIDPPVGAEATLNPADSTITFVAQQPGEVLFVYRVTDGESGVAEAVIRVRVVARAENHPPAAALDVVFVPQGGSRTVDLLQNDYDPDNDVLAATSIDVPDGSGVRASLLEHRRLRVALDAALSGPLALTYRVTDGIADVEGQVLVVMAPAATENLAPITVDDTAVVRAGDVVSVPVLANDSDPDGDDLTLHHQLVDPPADAVAFVSGSSVRYRAPADPGSVVLVYEVRDSVGNTNTGRVRITVRDTDGQGTAPAPLTIEARVVAGSSTKIVVPLTGIDVDGDSVVVDGLDSAPAQGRVVTPVAADSIQYEAFKDATPGPDEFRYRVRDSSGRYGIGLVRMVVLPRPERNQAPVAFDDQVTVRPGATVRVPVMANDFDPDGDPIDFTAGETLEVPDGIEAERDGTRLKVVAGDRPTAPILYRITDGIDESPGLLTVRIDPNATNQPPVARDDVVKTLEPADATTQAVPVLENDEDPDGDTAQLEISIVDPDADGVSIDGDRVVVELRDRPRTIAYAVSDGTDSATAFVKVPARGGAGNRPPQQSSSTPIEVATGAPATIEIGEYVTDPDGDRVTLTSGDRVWATHANGEPLVPSGQTEGAVTRIVFTSAPGFVGQASLTFEATDSKDVGGAPSTVVVSVPITVTAAGDTNQPPTFAFTSVIEVEQGEAGGEWDLAEYAEDPDGDEVVFGDFAATGLASGVEASLSGSTLTAVAAAEAQPAADAGSVTFSVGDGTATVDPAPAITVSVIPSKRPKPTASEDTFDKADAGKPFTFTTDQLLSNDFNPFEDAPLKVVSVTAPAAAGTVATSGDTHTFTPAAKTNGVVTLNYVIQDKTASVERQGDGLIRINVRDVPSAPAAPRVEATSSKQILLSWTPPEANGAPITGYKVEWTSDKGPGTFDGCTSNTCEITGLTNDVTYQFTVRAENEVGIGDPSPASGDARPDQRPEPPQSPRLEFDGTLLDGQLVMTWAAAEVDGSAVTDYEVQIAPQPPSGPDTVKVGTALTHTWTGLKNGTAYSATVRAYNRTIDAAGQLVPSDWSAVTTSTDPIPARQPDKVTPKPEANRVDDPVAPGFDVTWTAPSTAASGAAADNYRVTVFRNGTQQRVVETGGPVTNLRIPVARDDVGIQFQFSVTAANKAGWGLTDSDRSDPEETYQRPDAAPVPTVAEQDGALELTIAAMSDNASGGEPVVRYLVQGTVDGGAVQSFPQLVGSNRRITGLTNGARYRFQLKACNHATRDDYCSAQWGGQSAEARPIGPLGAPSINVPDGQTSFDVTWSLPDVNRSGRALTRVRVCINGGCADRSTTSGGSQRVNVAKETTTSATIEVTDEAGRTTNASDSGRSPDYGRNLSARWGSASSVTGCTSNCYRMVADFSDWPPGTGIDLTCQYRRNSTEGWRSDFGWDPPNLTLNGNGDGSTGDNNSNCVGQQGTAWEYRFVANGKASNGI